jgi:competence protein ComEA
MRIGTFIVLVFAFVMGPTTPASAQLPEGPGKDLILKLCGACHQAERSASVRLTREGWEEVIADMIKRGAKGTDEEFGIILEYLATHFLGEAPRPLNINRATNVELESVAGLTRKEAAAVLAYLDTVGVCKSLNELKKVPGLDYKKIEARKDFIVCFEAPPPPKEPKKQP